MRWCAILAVILFAISPAHPQKDRATSEHSATFPRQERNAIREAVFRYQFGHNASILGRRAAVYCLSVENGAYPPDDFMKRFGASKPPVRKAPECSTDPYNGVIEKTTGKRGVVFRLRAIKSISQTAPEVIGGHFEDGLSASGNTYTVKKINGRWRVTNASMNWLS